MSITTEVPTEVGTYLFVGSRRSASNDIADMHQPPQVELVRISRLPDGRLFYIGTDFMYTPHTTVGAWQKIDVADVKMVGLHALRREFVNRKVREMRGSMWSAPYGRDQLAAFIAPRFPTGRMKPDEMQALQEELADFAEAEGLLQADPSST